MKYKIIYTKQFKKSFKKLNEINQNKVLTILEKIANDEHLEAKYNDHTLKGKFSDYRDCHVKPDLVLIYEKDKTILILTAINIGSHSEVF